MYTLEQKGYHYYNLTTCETRVSKDVVFDGMNNLFGIVLSIDSNMDERVTFQNV